LKKGGNQEAIAQFRDAVNLNPAYAEAHNNLGAVLFAGGAADEAVTHYKNALDLKPDYTDARENLANAQLRKGDWDQAIANYTQVIKAKPRQAGAYGNLGAALFQKGQTQEAKTAWEKSLEIEPNQLDVMINLAWLLATAPDAALRDGPKAVALAKQAEQRTQDQNPGVLHTLAAAEAEAGSFGPARVTARLALELAVTQTNTALAAALQKEILLYDADKPLRGTVR
jgi:tetratricopeptide (TPR) repeat protein